MDKLLATEDIIARAAKGDRAAFAALVSRHYDFLYRTAYKWCGNREDAEDVTQDVCIKLAMAISGFDGRSAFTSWLYRIVLNAVRDRQRQGMRRNRQAEALAHVTASEMEPEQESAATQSQVWDAVRRLPEKQRDAVLLVYGEEMAHAEAAAIMGTRESTVSWYVHEAKKALKDLV
ncbi:RNA polymerase sigma factor [Pelagibacterium halotolerans]|uniref:Putative RNA polymerase sigma factor n=1 Tax=Pelagibacterium halotolerans (strain DSM 22347 / JCM 15775 / CGMCC 1.7692 / B2) TaxID=1082931 RepID=G4R924_PELHB|nr:RNA polymerase sigma factor [Pelagibacterium halotolerans]AEQ52404.1 putative RNA polymerase sigma factor [Pelagibacterium halotolerans B2]QJR17865.1 RNA polymerase sigma factor [Pelagibacterium halotolerans]SEA35419.1 RNA polymerase sigma-70 factor, ECF subfamily [Pelagibacterium halotolerans]